jgi:hypothetical protein
MTEWRVADIVPQGNGLDKVFVQPQETANGPGNLGDQLHMQDPVGYVVIVDQVKHLGFVNISGIGSGMENPVRIQGKGLPVADLLFLNAADTVTTVGGKRRQISLFALVKPLL